MQLILLFIFSTVTVCLCKSFAIALILSILFTLFFMVQAISFYTMHTPLNWVFIYHFDKKIIFNSYSTHKWQYLVASCLIPLMTLFFMILRYVFSMVAMHYSIFFGAVILCIASFAAMALPSGIIPNILNLARSALTPRTKDLRSALHNVGIAPELYITPDKLTVKCGNGKNVIALSLESFESVLLQNKEMTPNLNRLLNKFTFYSNVEDAVHITISSMYALNTGIPLAFGLLNRNAIFRGMKQEQLTSLPTILKKCGYYLCHLQAMPEFGGADDFLQSIGYDRVIGYKQDIKDYPEFNSSISSGWGLYDKDLFAVAKKEVLRLSKAKPPFFLSIASIDTHFPGAQYDPRFLEGQKPSEENKRNEALVRWTDALIGDFIDFLQDNHLLENTNIFLFPDHLSYRIPFETKNERKLYLLTNAPPECTGILPEAAINHFYYPKMILSSLGIESNATFFVDLVKTCTGERLDKAWEKKNQQVLTQLNQTLWRRSTADVLEISRKNKSFTIRRGKLEKTVEILLGNECLELDIVALCRVHEIRLKKVHYSSVINPIPVNGYRMGKIVISTFDVFSGPPDAMTESDVYATIRSNNEIVKRVEYHSDNGKIIINSSVLDSVCDKTAKFYLGLSSQKKQLTSKHKKEFTQKGNMLRLASVTDEGINWLDKSRIKLNDSKPLVLTTCLALVYESGANLALVKFSYDSADLRNFYERITLLLNQGKFFAIVSSGYRSIKNPDLFGKLTKLGLKKFARLNNGCAYVAYKYEANKVREFSSADSRKSGLPSMQLIVDLKICPTFSHSVVAIPSSANTFKTISKIIDTKRIHSSSSVKDINNFIAHAGGAIDGKTYTNSREAVLNSIELGFKFIELDLFETFDGRIVAAHDWRFFNIITGFQNDILTIPPSHAEATSRKIHGKYTVLDDKVIEDIFLENRDVFLVTDKLANFDLIARSFSFCDRILVEVFDVDGYFNALKAGFKFPIFCANSLLKITTALEYGFAIMSAPAQLILKYPDLFQQLRTNGVLIFCYNGNNREYNKEGFFESQFGYTCSKFYSDILRF